ncbi:PLDc N-terminal domain-containing protein [Lysinibacter sp. HNR]|uniref:PLDc N-terminal domain-containing protein n=1 Tax=Lysinibacter sp. HNR TaxID=3031408 RepID=UPI002435576E|nr:PLDc N-terminal domain-containing protein [Lysinibacter sp. HNR]WGD37801.1 PLDc N-terminal domain-containing protein [Lysinibacter sp. HNR]
MPTEPNIPLSGLGFMFVALFWVGLIVWGAVTAIKARSLSTGQRAIWIVIVILFPLLSTVTWFLVTPRNQLAQE